VRNKRVMLRKKAVMKRRYLKVAGEFIITEEQIIFRPLLGKRDAIIPLKEVVDARVEGKLRKKLVIKGKGGKYIFFMKGAENVHRLLAALLPNIYKNSSHTIT